MLGTVLKQPADQRDYDVEFDKWLPEDDTITTAVAGEIEADADDESPVVVESVQIDGTTVKVWASGGTTGKTYKVTLTVSTSGGRIKETEFNIRVRDC
jgi:hypothetical protein